jgi:sterol desaturase/sphingolipid hydroxylase (fatty acid hydroxylase superfamily)
METVAWLWGALAQAGTRVPVVFHELWLEFSTPKGRYFWGCLLSALMIAAVLYWREAARSARSWRDFLGWALPKSTYTSPTFRVDVGLNLLNLFLVPGSWLVEGLALEELDDLVVQAGHGLSGGTLIPGEVGLAGKLAVGLFVFLAYDFAMWFHHWLHHKVPVLWELHRVHHSAEHLNPLTADRFHPLEEMLKGLIVVPITLVALGLAGIVFDLSAAAHGFALVKIWFFFRLFNLVGGNLRHMHVWWSWPAWIARVISSPAQHQIHHSIDTRHYGKNLASMFSLWDWLFGTLYQPTEREHLTFGVNEGQRHESLWRTLWQPVQGVWQRASTGPRLGLAPLPDDATGR